jgi:transposase
VKKATRVKTINGNEYLYEITYYYDSKLKKTRQKSKYLGKYVDGGAVRVRKEATDPKTVYTVGEFLLYQQARLELDLDTLLRKYLTATEIKILLLVVYAGLTDQTAFYNPAGWYHNTVMYMRNPSLKFDLQVIMKLLQKIGNSQIPALFSRNLMHFLKTIKTSVYDISIGTSIRDNELYNDSIASIEQKYENIIVIYDAKANLPISYIPRNHTLPGMPSSQEANAALKSLELSTKKCLLIQNRNSCTQMNLYELQNSNMPYLLPVPADAPEIKEIETQNQTMLMHHNNANLYNNNLIFRVPFNTIIHDKPVRGYLYGDPQKSVIEQRRISEDILQICERLKQVHVHTWMNPANIVKEIAGIYEPFIEWNVEGHKLNVTVKTKTLSERMKKVGQFALLYSNANLGWDTCLSHYDIQAHDSHFLRQLMERKLTLPYSAHTPAIIQGLLFVSYLSLLLKRWAINQMKKSGLLHLYTPEKIFLELENIKLIKYTSHKIVHTTLNTKQEEILAAMKMQIEY